MSVDTKKYVRKPLIVNGLQITNENFIDVANWCDGTIRRIDNDQKVFRNGKITGTIDPLEGSEPIDPSKQYIEIKVINPRRRRQSIAYVGDWILHTESGFKIYTTKAFESNFNLCETD